VDQVRLVVNSAQHVVVLEKGQAVLSGAAILERVQIRSGCVVRDAHVPELTVGVRRDEDLLHELIYVYLRFHYFFLLLVLKFL
jgi:hypothetical protein